MALQFPPFYLLRAGFEGQTKAFQELESEIGLENIVFSVGETNLIVGKISKPARAMMELKALNIFTQPATVAVKDKTPTEKLKTSRTQKSGEEMDFVLVDDSDTASEDGGDGDVVMVNKPKVKPASSSVESSGASGHNVVSDEKDIVKVIRLDWATDSMKAGKVLPMNSYLVYTGCRIDRPSAALTRPVALVPHENKNTFSGAPVSPLPPPPSSSQISRQFTQSSKRKRPPLLSETTTEHDAAANLPPLPDYCAQRYSCLRPTPYRTCNDPFIAQLKKLHTARGYIDDQRGELSYNRAIASIAAYPHTITSVAEISRLWGCSEKLAGLFQEWRETGRIQEVVDNENSEKIQALALFYGIYGVRGKTAIEFYQKGWVDLFDVREGWSTLKREQQVGLKWYEEFQAKIPRAEVEAIGKVVLDHANNIQEGFQMVICGGYRRGKKMCGDADLILTHPDESATEFFIEVISDELVKSGWITHTLNVNQSNSRRNQQPAPTGSGTQGSHSGFGSLDHALTVWQDPHYPGDEEEGTKNPNIHRRVDIIITPWKTAGCAIVGWTGGTMFERDIRTYCTEKFGYRFDSSGIRALDVGTWIDLEGDETDLLVKEKKVFEGLEMPWLEPEMRCTDG